MRAVVITRPGPPEVLEIHQRPDPVPDDDQVLIRVQASALNRADLLQRRGAYPPPPGVPADIPGLELAGEVIGRGARASRWKIGDRVFGLVSGGAHAELAVAHERVMAPVPDVLAWDEAAAVPEAFITAYDALVTQGGLRPGARVLIHAVGSGVGLAAVQIVRGWGAVPFGTARTAGKIERARELGLEDGAVVGGAPDIGAAVARWSVGGFDIILDLVGGAYVGASADVMALKGRLIVVGLLAGREPALDLGTLLRRRLTIIGTVLRSRSLEEKIGVTESFTRDIVPRLADRTLRPVIDRRYPIAQVREAHEQMERNATQGKLVLAIAGAFAR